MSISADCVGEAWAEDALRTLAALLPVILKSCRHRLVCLSSQALASFIEDCTDEALAEDAIGTLAALLPPAEAASAPVAGALQRLGGLALVAPLLRRPRQALRVAGLRILAALLPLVTDAHGENMLPYLPPESA